MRARDYLKLKEFRAWLEAQDPVDIVGVVRDQCRSPLARFLTYRGISGVRVLTAIEEEWIGFSKGRLQYDFLPPWARKFSQTINKGLSQGMPVTAKVALTVLKIGELPEAV